MFHTPWLLVNSALWLEFDSANSKSPINFDLFVSIAYRTLLSTAIHARFYLELLEVSLIETELEHTLGQSLSFSMSCWIRSLGTDCGMIAVVAGSWSYCTRNIMSAVSKVRHCNVRTRFIQNNQGKNEFWRTANWLYQPKPVFSRLSWTKIHIAWVQLIFTAMFRWKASSRIWLFHQLRSTSKSREPEPSRTSKLLTKWWATKSCGSYVIYFQGP